MPRPRRLGPQAQSMFASEVPSENQKPQCEMAPPLWLLSPPLALWAFYLPVFNYCQTTFCLLSDHLVISAP